LATYYCIDAVSSAFMPLVRGSKLLTCALPRAIEHSDGGEYEDTLFLDVTPCSLVKVLEYCLCFGWSGCLHYQGNHLLQPDYMVWYLQQEELRNQFVLRKKGEELLMISVYIYMYIYVCVCVCVCARACV